MMKQWHEELDEADLAFIKRFVLASGSLKEIAALYGVSYPTVRLRLDRLIDKLKLLEREDLTDDFEKLLRIQYAEQKIDSNTFNLLLTAYNNRPNCNKQEVK